MIAAIARRNITRIIPFGIIWLIAGIIYSLLERGLLGNLREYPTTGNPYHFISTFWITAITAVLLGCFFGALEVLYVSRLFEKRTLVEKIIYKTIIYLLINICF